MPLHRGTTTILAAQHGTWTVRFTLFGNNDNVSDYRKGGLFRDAVLNGFPENVSDVSKPV